MTDEAEAPAVDEASGRVDIVVVMMEMGRMGRRAVLLVVIDQACKAIPRAR